MPTNPARYRFLPLVLLLILLANLLSGCSIDSSLGQTIDPVTDDTAAQLPADPMSTDEQALTESQAAQNFIIVEEIAIGLLLIAALVGIATRRLRVPYTVGLVLIGLALALRGQNEVAITPELILAVLVPPLVFEAAFHLKITDLRRNLVTILALAIPGVLITTFLVGGVVAWGAGLPLSIALVFGALVAATDPVAVVALFRSLGVPKRLQVLLEGESLFNDGTAIVVFHLMIGVAISHEFSLLQSVLDFLFIAGGGLAIGFVLGILISNLISRVDDPLIETTLTAVLAFGSYLVAEQLHVSGVLAVVAAGLVSGNIGPRGMSPSTRMLVFNFWEIAAFLANSFIFLLIGLQIDLLILFANWKVSLWAIAAVLAARAVSIYGLSWLGPGVPHRFKPVLFWGGLRGAISLALALSLPVALGSVRSELQAMAFGVVLFTLLVQGLSMRPLVRRMKLVSRSQAQEEYELRHARAAMSKAALDRLENLYKDSVLSTHSWKMLEPKVRQRAKFLAEAATQVLNQEPQLEADELEAALRDLLQTQRNTLTTMLRENLITEDIYTRLVREVDSALTEPRTDLIAALRHRADQPVDQLMTAILQEQDAELADAELTRLGVMVSRLPSTGSFLGRQNTTLLIAVPEGRARAVMRILRESSQERVEFVPTPGSGSQDATRQSVKVGKATIFSFEVERYLEL
ncbi:MAG: Na+/H+ antiporter [Anaerolineales bacterium]|nr:Na+/H+ antiporter [Anaerolineales bacterium]